MRTLRFIVDGMNIAKDPNCDFSGLVPGPEGYLQAEFSFSREWDNYAKAAAFYSPMGREYSPQILSDGRTCVIPAEACKLGSFGVRIFGKNPDGLRLKTNKTTVCQDGGKA